MRAFSIVGLSLLVLVAGILAFRYGGNFNWSMQWRPPDQGTAPAAELGDVGPVVPLEPFLVTEWEGEEQHWITVTFELEVEDALARDAVKARTSEIRSRILALLADTHLNAMGDASEYEMLKTKVHNRIQTLLPNHTIRRVLITEFLTQ